MSEGPVICTGCGKETATEGILCHTCLGMLHASIDGVLEHSEIQPSQDDGWQLTPGASFVNGRFVLERLLGEGGMGQVWLARDQKLSVGNQHVALKFISRRLRSDEAMMTRLADELEKNRLLNHDCIVRAHELHEQPGEPPFIGMEYVNGADLEQTLRRAGGVVFEWPELAGYIGQVCSALCHAHAKGVIHRDLKPSNLLVGESGQVKLGDFGLARFLPVFLSGSDGPRVVEGSLGYMSPQQYAGEPPSVGDDIYALGASIYELLTGGLPIPGGPNFGGRLLGETPQRILERRRAAGRPVGIPYPVERAVMDCLAKDPSQRPPDVATLARRLGVGGPDSAGAGRPPPSLARAWNWETQGTAQNPRQPHPQAVPSRDWEWGEEATPRRKSSDASFIWGFLALLILAGTGAYFWPDISVAVRQLSKPGPNAVVTNPVVTNPVVTNPVVTNPVVVDPPATPAVVRFVVRGFEAYSTLARTVRIRLLDSDGAVAASDTASGTAGATSELHVKPGDYICEAGLDGTDPIQREWIRVPLRLTDGTNWQRLDFTKRTLQLEVDKGVRVKCKDGWGNDILVQEGNPNTSKGTPYWITEKLCNGEIILTVSKRDYRSFHTNYTLTADSPYFSTLVLPPPAQKHEQPQPELSWANSLGTIMLPCRGFWAAWTETTVGAWSQFAEETGFRGGEMLSVTTNGWKFVGRDWRNPGFEQTVSHAVVGVSWHDAMEFCAWLTDRERNSDRLGKKQRYRLPTDAEWGQIARESSRYIWGNDQFPPPTGSDNYAGEEARDIDYDPQWPVLDGNRYSRDRYPRTAPVTYGDKSDLDFHGLGGNVSEWCMDWYSTNLNRNPVLDSLSPSVFEEDPSLADDGGGNRFRVVRGSCWFDGDAVDRPYHLEFITALRRFAPPEARSDRIGFRMVLEGNPDE